MDGKPEMIPTLRVRTMDSLRARRQRVLEGKVNRIPSPFARFSRDFIGLEQSTYYTVTSGTKGGKSQFVSYVFIYKPLMYCYESGADIDMKVIYFPLEESKETIMQRFMSWLLCEMSRGKVRISPRDLRSTTEAVDQDILEMLESEEMRRRIEYFEDHVIFPDEQGNPTGIYNYCRRYAEEHGTVHTRKGIHRDAFGNQVQTEVFDWYEMANPNEYRILVVDTINLIDTERGMSLKDSMDKLSEYCAKYLRNRYGFSPVIIQQQAFSSEGVDAIRADRAKPTVATLGDSKYTSRDSNVVLGLFDPFRVAKREYMGYDIMRFRDSIRFLEVLVNRDGEMGGICPLLFDGATCHFAELPRPDDKDAMARVYKALEANQTPGNVARGTLLMMVGRIRKMLTNQKRKEGK